MASFEFVRLGMPCSVQTANRSRVVNYKADLRRIARARWDGNMPPTQGRVKVAIDFYYETDELDVDNIIKPVLDQLNGLVYEDDKQIVEITCRKQALPASDTVRENASAELVRGLRAKEPFLHVRSEWGDDMENQPEKKQPDRIHETAQLYRASTEETAEEAVSAGTDEIEQLLSDMGANASSRLVRLFAALEAALRLAFDKVGLKPSSNQTYSLIAKGTSIAFLEQSEYWELTRLMKIRDAIVHGYQHAAPTEDDLLLLAEVTHRVITESETAKLEYDY